MSVFCRQDVIHKAADLRVRPVPEWACLLIYTPSRPNLHYLDAHSWLIFELCDGRTISEIEADFTNSLPQDTQPQHAERVFAEILTKLSDGSVIQITPAAP